MLVRGNGSAKGNISQVLQGVGKGVVLGVPRLPEAVSRGEFLRRKGGKSQQIVRPVFNHVDSQVVPRIDAKVWPVCIAKSESFKFQKAIEGRVLHPFDLWDVHQATDGFRIPYLAVGREHRTQLERQHVRILAAYITISVSDLCRRLALQTSSLEQDRYAIKASDGLDLLSIERDDVAAEMFNVRAGYKGD